SLRRYVTQKDIPSWGLGRISSREPGSDKYVYHQSAGEDTCSYIVDTGIYPDHPEFEGRAEQIKNYASNATSDDNGHGTHVAGTIGSKSYGVAKKTKLLGIKVLNQYGSGTWSDVIAGIGYAVTDSATRDCPNGAVINMSLGGERSQAINDAVAAAVDAGVFVAVSAGNDGLNSDAFSPASEPKAFTVGATDRNDNITSFSNYGFLVDSFAPGLDINSTWIGGPDAFEVISGTSMASPHVAGLASYLLGIHGPLKPADLASKIKVLSTKNKVKNIFPNTGTPNFLAYNGRPLF
ncbi:cuticle-degrading protease from Paecilomyces Lilacinus, partial [Tothia fuscella]